MPSLVHLVTSLTETTLVEVLCLRLVLTKSRFLLGVLLLLLGVLQRLFRPPLVLLNCRLRLLKNLPVIMVLDCLKDWRCNLTTHQSVPWLALGLRQALRLLNGLVALPEPRCTQRCMVVRLALLLVARKASITA